MYKCKKTKRQFETQRGFLNHLRKVYQSIDEAYLEENNKIREICPYCNTRYKRFRNFETGFLEHCCDKSCWKIFLKKSNGDNARIRKQKKKIIDDKTLKEICSKSEDEFKNKNYDFMGCNTGDITLNQFLSRNFIKLVKNCKYCEKEFIIQFNNITKDRCGSKSCTQLYKYGYFEIVNNLSKKELNNKWLEFALNFSPDFANNEIKKYMRSSLDFKNIYTCLSDEVVEIDGWLFSTSHKSTGVFDFISKFIDKKHWENLVYFNCLNCGELADTNKSLIKRGIKKYCSHKCYIDFKVKNPNVYPYSDETKLKQSILLKNKILNGDFTPATTNSWCKSRIAYNGMFFRSSWEFLFYILYEKKENLQFEQLRIPYEYNGNNHSYIPDFIDYTERKVFEIKPNSAKDSQIVRIKENALKQWCFDNDFNYEMVGDDFFKTVTITSHHKKLIIEHSLEKKLKLFLN